MQFSGNANSEVMRGSPYAAYYLVLLTVCASTLFAPPSIVRVIASHCGGNSRVVGSILDLLQKTLVICAVIVGVTWGERLPLSSIGLKPPATTDLIFGFVGFLSYMLLVTTIFYGFVAGPFIGLVRPPNLRGFDRISGGDSASNVDCDTARLWFLYGGALELLGHDRLHDYRNWPNRLFRYVSAQTEPGSLYYSACPR